MRTNLYIDMCKLSGSKNIIHASGTAVKASSLELLPLFKVLDKRFNSEVEADFKKIFNKSANRAREIMANRLTLISKKISTDVTGRPKPITVEVKVKVPDPSKYLLDSLKLEYKTFMSERLAYYAPQAKKFEESFNKGISYYTTLELSHEEKSKLDVYIGYINMMRKGYDNMTMGFMSEYCNKFEKEYIIPKLPKELAKEFKEYKSLYKYTELVCQGQFLGGVLARRRAELHSELLQHSGLDEIVNNANKKTICFTDFVDTVYTAKRYFENKGFEPLIVTAETASDLTGIVTAFKTINEKNPLIATYRMLSAGQTLIEANTIVLLNQPFRSKDRTQAIARADRIGQTDQVYVYEVILDTGDLPNLSTRMQEIMSWSEDNVAVILGNSGIQNVNKEEFVEKAIQGNIGFLETTIQPVNNLLKL